ncbi:MAG: methionyl-tRNA formyltransferase [Anaerolineae bacterium]|nr:methionyl-tRNA formyltransferase [Anaerolineae bacterium]
MRIVFFSYRGTIGARCLQWLLQQPQAEVLAVVTWPDYVHPEIKIAVKEVLYDAHLPLYQPRDVNSSAFVALLHSLRPDLFVSMYFGKLFKAPLLSVPPQGCVNIHNSLLPRYRGQAPNIWAVANGDTVSGQTMHYLDEGMDTGDIIARKEIPVDPADTGYTLGAKLEDLGVELFKEAFPAVLNGTAGRQKQDDSQATVCRAPRPHDARIDWTRPAPAIANFVRAFTRPYMGAFTRLGGLTVRVWSSRPAPELPWQADAAPGDVAGVEAEGPIVRCGQGHLILTDFEVEGIQDRSSALSLLSAGRRSCASFA